MTLPNNGDIPVNQYPGIKMAPNGGVDFPGSGAAVSATGKLNIWNLPKGLPPTIWFDTGHNSTGDLPSEDRGGIHPGQPILARTRDTSFQQMLTPEQTMKQFAAMSVKNPNQYLALQQTLGVKVTGSWDSATKDALVGAMQSYTQVKDTGAAISFKDWLLQKGAYAQQLGIGSNRQPTINLTDPTQIRDAAQQAAVQALGQGLSSEQLNKFVAQFQAQQVQSQSDVYTTSTKLPAEAMAFAQSADPGAYKDNQRQSYINSLVDMFAPSGSQRPSMTPTPSVTGG